MQEVYYLTAEYYRKEYNELYSLDLDIGEFL